MFVEVVEDYLRATMGAPVIGMWMIGVSIIVYVGMWFRKQVGWTNHANPPHDLFYAIGLAWVYIRGLL